MNNKITIEINNNEISTQDFGFLVTILSKCKMQENFDINLIIPEKGFKIIGNWVFLSELAQIYYKNFIKMKVINNIRVLTKKDN